MKHTILLRLLSAFVCSLAVLLPASLRADGAIPSASQGGVSWQVTAPNDGVALRVIMPDGSAFEQKYASGQSPSFVSKRGVLPDGPYHWEIVASPIVSPELRARAQSARANDQTIEMPSGSTESGSFRVVNGSVMLPDSSAVEPGTRRGNAPIQPNDQVINDDLIVIGSECVGFDCVNGENFGFDTLRLKENNLRVKFMDTSNSGSFPRRDWRIRINESTNGGQNAFFIDDMGNSNTTGNEGEQVFTPFSIEAGATNNSLVVSDSIKSGGQGGRIGLGTASPSVDIHTVNGDTPTVRLEQNGSSGFTPQTWDIAGNETSFFIRDVTNGSRLPLRIRPNAPSSSIDIATSGNVGFGTSSPSDGDGLAERFIEVKSTSGDARVVVDSTDNANIFGEVLFQRDNNNKWSFGNDNSRFYIFNYIAGAGNGNAMTIDNATSNVVIPKNLTVNGTFANPSSREIKHLLASVDGSSVLAKLSSLPLFTWSYKNDESVRHFGPVAEDFYERWQLGLDEKHISPNDMAGVALAATQALKNEKDAEIEVLKERLARLESLLGAQPKNKKTTEEQ